jgi:hypothetical protein
MGLSFITLNYARALKQPSVTFDYVANAGLCLYVWDNLCAAYCDLNLSLFSSDKKIKRVVWQMY